MRLGALALGGCFLASAAGDGVRAQESVPVEEKPARMAPEKIDEYGRLGHCDLTARLDNLASMLQNEPGSKAFLVGYDPEKRRAGYADKRLKMAHYYLTHERGIDAARVFVVNAGSKPVEDVVTELWIAPSWSAPPVPLPEPEPPGKQFSGKLDYYYTDDQTYREFTEMGTPESAIAYSDFAEKLKAQPGSVGYIVVRSARDSRPGSSRRIGRRDERILRTHYEIDAGRLKSIDGGQSEGESSLVEFWVLSKDAPPPAGVAEKSERRMTAAYELNTLGTYDAPEADELEWALDNLAESLREDPHARVCLIIRQYEGRVEEAEDEEDVTANETDGVAAPPTEPDAADGVSEMEPPEPPELPEATFDPLAVAERWRKTLAEKYGVDERRVFVMLGRPKDYGYIGTLSTWIVPKDAPLPDPRVVTADPEEPEETPDPAGTQPAPAARPTPGS